MKADDHCFLIEVPLDNGDVRLIDTADKPYPSLMSGYSKNEDGYNFGTMGIGEKFISTTKYTFNIMAYYLSMLHIWDFCGDVLLFEDIFEHNNQASVDNPQRKIFEIYMTLCGMFISLPFIANVAFLAFWTVKISNTESYDDDNTVAGQVAQEWLQNLAYVLVRLCFFSGSLTASLKMVNSNLFGLKYCSVRISKNKQEETVGFTLFTVFLSFPKHYFFIHCK